MPPRIPKGLASSANPELQKLKDDALMIYASAVLSELKTRAADGTMAEEFKKMRLSQVTFHLQKIAEVLKQPTVVNNGIILPPAADKERLRVFSPGKMTEDQKLRLDRKMKKKLIEGEVVKPRIKAEIPKGDTEA